MLKKKKLPVPIKIMLSAAVLLVLIFVARGSAYLIENITTYQTVKMFTEVRLAFYLYQSRYQKLPGDDNLLPPRGGDWDAFTANGAMAGNGDGQIDPYSTPYAESSLVWLHLRLAGLIPGDFTNTSAPRLPSGVELNILTTTLSDITATYVCAYHLDPKTAQRISSIYNSRNRSIIDTDTFEDKPPSTFLLRMTAGVNNPNTSSLCTALF